MAGVELLKGKIVRGGLERWVGVGVVAATDGIGSCVPLKGVGFGHETESHCRDLVTEGTGSVLDFKGTLLLCGQQ